MKLDQATLLFVDDEPMLLEILEEIFSPMARLVHLAGNGREALACLKVQPVDLVISDIRMPVLDGIGMLKELNAWSTFVPKIIFVSGYTDFEETKLLALGAAAFLHKPLDPGELVRHAEQTLAAHSRRGSAS